MGTSREAQEVINRIEKKNTVWYQKNPKENALGRMWD
jgi:hypothetical protein